jgi:hypothetical protein
LSILTIVAELGYELACASPHIQDRSLVRVGVRADPREPLCDCDQNLEMILCPLVNGHSEE